MAPQPSALSACDVGKDVSRSWMARGWRDLRRVRCYRKGIWQTWHRPFEVASTSGDYGRGGSDARRELRCYQRVDGLYGLVGVAEVKLQGLVAFSDKNESAIESRADER